MCPVGNHVPHWLTIEDDLLTLRTVWAGAFGARTFGSSGAAGTVPHRSLGVIGIEHTVTVTVSPVDDAGKLFVELFDRHRAVAVVVMGLETIDHPLAHRVQPECFVLGEIEAAVLVRVKLGELGLAHGENLLLRDAAVAVSVKGLDQHVNSTLAAAMPAGTVLALLAFSTILVMVAGDLHFPTFGMALAVTRRTLCESGAGCRQCENCRKRDRNCLGLCHQNSLFVPTPFKFPLRGSDIVVTQQRLPPYAEKQIILMDDSKEPS